MVQDYYSEVVEDILAPYIVDKCGCNHTHHNTLYLIKWVACPQEAAFWANEVDLWQFDHLIQEYHNKAPLAKMLDFLV